MVLVMIALVLVIVGLLYVFTMWNYDYWRKRQVPGPKPSAFTGNFPSMFNQKRHMIYDIDDIYRAFKKDNDFVGIYSSRSPQLMIISPELVHRVFVSDFKHFHDNDLSQVIDEKSDYIIANNPFTLTGDNWKERRAEITPGLTMGRIKSVYPVTKKICNELSDYIRQQLRIGQKHGIEAKDLVLRFTSELVTDCVLGVRAESFTDKPTPILGYINKLFEQSWSLILYFFLTSLLPKLRSIYKVRFIPLNVESFFISLMNDAIALRQTQMHNGQQLEREDFLNYIIQLKEKKQLSMRQLTARTMTFLLDGFETTAAVLSHALLLIARDAVVQEKLLAEIRLHLNGDGVVDFDKLHDLPYLDACIQETLRIFPPGFISGKVCTKPIELTNKNGLTYTVPIGTSIVVPLYSVMNDEDHFPEPQQFQPDRFIEPDAVKRYREMGIFLGFGDGPRICLGMRFALTQVKAALVELVSKFQIKANPKTRKDNLFDPAFFMTRLDGGIWLDFESRT